MIRLNLDFDSQRMAQVHADWIRWWDGTLETPLVVCEGYRDGWKESHPDSPKRPNWTFAGKYPLDMPAETVVDDYQKILEGGYFLGACLPKFYVNAGPGVLAAFLGAGFKFLEGSAWFSPPTVNGVSWEQTPLEKIHLTFNKDHPLLNRIRNLMRAGIERFGNQVVYGLTDIGGNLDVLASLVGSQRLAMELHDRPAEVERLCEEIRVFWLDCYNCLHADLDAAGMGSSAWASVWAPGRSYMLQSDFAYMISPAMFKRFVMPDLKACCDAMSYPFYHLDGKGQIRHLDQLLSLEKLRGIQWVQGDGAPPAEEWLDLLRRIREGGKRCQVYVTAKGARKIMDALGGKGFVFDIIDDMTRNEAERVVEELTRD